MTPHDFIIRNDFKLLKRTLKEACVELRQKAEVTKVTRRHCKVLINDTYPFTIVAEDNTYIYRKVLISCVYTLFIDNPQWNEICYWRPNENGKIYTADSILSCAKRMLLNAMAVDLRVRI